MKTLAFLLALFGAWGQDPKTEPTNPDVLQYQNLTLGLKFEYPKTWQVVTDKRGQSKFLIPIEGTSDRAVVEVEPVSFRQEKDSWQITQLAFNKSKKRETVRQWEEEILGVPLLLTEAKYNERGSERQVVSGLIYTFGFNKMLYRVTASPEQFANVDYSWRQVLQSLRTWTGELPKVEDPSVEIKVNNPKDRTNNPNRPPDDDIPHPTVPNEIKTSNTRKFVKEPVVSQTELNGLKVEFHVPADWKLTPGADGTYTLTSSALDGKVDLKLQSQAATFAPATALAQASGASLAEFASVDKRDDDFPKFNKAGMPVAQVWRVGKTASGAMMSLDASGQSGDAYFIASYKTADIAKFKAIRKVIESLLDRMSIETIQ